MTTSREAAAARQVATAYRKVHTPMSYVIADAFEEYANALDALDEPPRRVHIQPSATEGPNAS